jgi:hypothetical protein
MPVRLMLFLKPVFVPTITPTDILSLILVETPLTVDRVYLKK